MPRHNPPRNPPFGRQPLAEFASSIGERQSSGSPDADGLPFGRQRPTSQGLSGPDTGLVASSPATSDSNSPVNVLSTHEVRPIGAFDGVLISGFAFQPSGANTRAAGTPTSVPEGYVFLLREVRYRFILQGLNTPTNDIRLFTSLIVDGVEAPYHEDYIVIRSEGNPLYTQSRVEVRPMFRVFDQGTVLNIEYLLTAVVIPTNLGALQSACYFFGTFLPRTSHGSLALSVASPRLVTRS